MTKMKRILSWALCLVFLCGMLPLEALADTLPADVSEPAEGNLMVDVTGKFLSCGPAEALRRLNTYRYQACYHGEKDPRDASHTLALDDRSGGEKPSDAVLAQANGDYVPARWSYELERIAEIRAAEGSVYRSHTRPNGKICFSAEVNGVTANAECLAWGNSMLGGMEQWYSERAAWLGEGKGETGHYTAMISPAYVSYGIAAFSDSGTSSVTVALEAKRSALSNRDGIGRKGQHVQRMEIARNAVTGVSAGGKETMDVGSTQTLTASADVRYSGLGVRTATFPIVKGASWTSSDDSVVSVDADGRVHALKAGTATVTVTAAQKTGSVTIRVGGDQYHTVTFDGTGGTPDTDEKRIPAGSPVGELPGAARDGYTLEGWFTQPDGGSRLTESWVPEGSVLVYARWTADPGPASTPKPSSGSGPDPAPSGPSGTPAADPAGETLATPASGNVIVFEKDGLPGAGNVEVDGVPYAVTGNTVVLPKGTKASFVTQFTYNRSSGDAHEIYPTGMKVWEVVSADGGMTARRIPALDNILQYAGSSIRITGKKGIRMITSVPKSRKKQLTGKGVSGYKLQEYGTAVAWDRELAGAPLTFGHSACKRAHAYKKGADDPVYNQTSKVVQYTNVLVDLTNEKCVDDLAMRPYMVLKNKAGQSVTLYGGTVHRSIGYIAYQNRAAFKAGTGQYAFLWDIIHYVYGDRYDAEYKQ